jgi:hypothetical protein
MGDRRYACSILAGTSQRKSPLERGRLRWNDNIEMDHQEVVWVEWNGLIWLGIGTHGRQN